MNSFEKRDWELYNFDQMGASTEYDNILINKDIDNYFNELISKPIQNQNTSMVAKSNYNFEKFYYDYIEHNLLFIVLLVGIIIFLIIRHYIKDFDTFGIDTNKSNDNNDEVDIKTYKMKNNDEYEKNNIDGDDLDENDLDENETNDNEYLKRKKLNKLKIKKFAQIKRKQQSEKIKLINYKKQLDKEKEKILSIIDELSNINDYENTRLKPYPSYLGENINMNYGTNYINTQKFFNQSQDNIPKLPHNLDDSSHYYDINKNFDDDTNKIDDLYIEPPFN